MSPLPRSFYARHALAVARDLLGCRLVRRIDGQRLSGIILEAEAYEGEEDLACHARAGRTPRTRIMYGPPGFAYIYFTYGMHWMLNAVAEPEDQPAAVLLRAIQPGEGLEAMAALRPNLAHTPHWTDGPAKLTQALALDIRQNGLDLCDPSGELFIEPGEPIPDERVSTGPRVGLFTTPEPWKSIPWRFRVTRNSAGLPDEIVPSRSGAEAHFPTEAHSPEEQGSGEIFGIEMPKISPDSSFSPPRFGEGPGVGSSTIPPGEEAR